MAEMISTHLSEKNVSDSLAAITAYTAAVQSAFQKLDTAVKSLQESQIFIGEASDGYLEAYQTVAPALSTNLYESEDSITKGLENTLRVVETLRTEVDPALKAANTGTNAQ